MIHHEYHESVEVDELAECLGMRCWAAWAVRLSEICNLATLNNNLLSVFTLATVTTTKKRDSRKVITDPNKILCCEVCGKNGFPKDFSASGRFCSLKCVGQYTGRRNKGREFVRHVKTIDGKIIKKRKKKAPTTEQTSTEVERLFSYATQSSNLILLITYYQRYDQFLVLFYLRRYFFLTHNSNVIL